MNSQRYLLEIDSVRAKRGGHGKHRTRMRGADFGDDALPQRESMTRRHMHNRKCSDGKVYSVLKGFLRSRIGQPWDEVYSELCRKLRRGSELDAYVRDCVSGLVLQNVRIDEAGAVREMPMDCGLWDDFYVHPQTGTLQFAHRKKREKREHKPLVETKKVGDVVRYAKCRGIWYEVTLLPVPTEQDLQEGSRVVTPGRQNYNWSRPGTPVDVIVYERALAPSAATLNAPDHWNAPHALRVLRGVWGSFVYAAKKRQLNGDELAREGLRNDPMA